ncbi:MAG: hypothetical protein ACFFB5_01920 [Promethearchaeota archaeon]
MKRTPLAVIIDLMVGLNTLLLEEDYSINTVSEITNLHWESTNRYLEIIRKIQDYSPFFTFTQDRKIRILARNPNLNIENDDLILVYSLQNKAFDEQSAIVLPNSLNAEIEFLLDKEFGVLQKNRKFFLTQRGKEMALDIFLEIQQKIESAQTAHIGMNDFDFDKLRKINLKQREMESIADNIIAIIFEKLEKSKCDKELEVH